jgi:LysM repeat protein
MRISKKDLFRIINEEREKLIRQGLLEQGTITQTINIPPQPGQEPIELHGFQIQGMRENSDGNWFLINQIGLDRPMWVLYRADDMDMAEIYYDESGNSVPRITNLSADTIDPDKAPAPSNSFEDTLYVFGMNITGEPVEWESLLEIKAAVRENESLQPEDFDPFEEISSEPITYTIARGDYLSGIARRFYGSTSREIYQQIATANNISDPNLIRSGSTIILPPVTLQTGEIIFPTNDESSTSRASGQLQATTYGVRDGRSVLTPDEETVLVARLIGATPSGINRMSDTSLSFYMLPYSTLSSLVESYLDSERMNWGSEESAELGIEIDSPPSAETAP